MLALTAVAPFQDQQTYNPTLERNDLTWEIMWFAKAFFFFAIQDSERKKRGRRSSFQAYILSLEESRVHFVYFVTLFTALLTSSCPAFRKCRCPQTPRRVRSSSRLVPFLPDHTDSPLLVKAPVHLFSCRMEQRPPPPPAARSDAQSHQGHWWPNQDWCQNCWWESVQP